MHAEDPGYGVDSACENTAGRVDMRNLGTRAAFTRLETLESPDLPEALAGFYFECEKLSYSKDASRMHMTQHMQLFF